MKFRLILVIQNHIRTNLLAHAHRNNPPLTITLEGQAVAPPVVGPPGRTSLIGRVTLGPQTPVALASRSQAAQLTMLVDRLAEPVHPSILWIQENRM